MSTARTVIKNAFRKAGITGLGTSLTAAQAAQGLELLQQTYADLVNQGTLGDLKEKYTEADYEAKEFERVYASVNTLVITFPTVVTDKYTYKTRAPIDGAVIVVVGPDRVADVRIYDALAAAWQPTTGYTLSTEAAMSGAYKSAIEALLAGNLADERELPIGPILARDIKTAKYHFAHRGNRPSDVQEGVYY